MPLLIRIRPHVKSGAAERVNRSAPFSPHSGFVQQGSQAGLAVSGFGGVLQDATFRTLAAVRGGQPLAFTLCISESNHESLCLK